MPPVDPSLQSFFCHIQNCSCKRGLILAKKNCQTKFCHIKSAYAKSYHASFLAKNCHINMAPVDGASSHNIVRHC